MEKKDRAKRHDTWKDFETWNPRKWLPGFEDPDSPGEGHGDNLQQTRSTSPLGSTAQVPLSRSISHPHISRPLHGAGPRWARLKSLLPQIIGNGHNEQALPSSSVAGKAVNITDELIAGGLSSLILRMWFERDENGARRIPVLLHRLRIRVSDSLHPLHGTKTVFRIECEYANGAARWVVYRQLRDLISLHAHYRVSNVYNRNVDALPEFPRTSLPYFNFLKKQNRESGRAEPGRSEFAQLQRQAIENYLIGLVRAVMFHPTSNRLSRFLEVSALFIRLAQSGGHQAKAGILQIEGASGTKGAFARKGLGWREKKKSKWCAVRESYLVVQEDPGEVEIFEVFMLDSDFKIERPKRVYRRGFSLLHSDHKAGESTANAAVNSATAATAALAPSNRSEVGTMRSIKSGFERVFHYGRDRLTSTHSLPLDSPGETRQRHHRRASSISSSSNTSSFDTDLEDDEDVVPSALVDPSTNADPLNEPLSDDEAGSRPNVNASTNEEERAQQTKRRKRNKEVSKHTFFIENSQMRLKLFASNARLMKQWITALERVAQTSHWTRKNRFESFAPIRLNVAAQWLVDGRDYFWNLSRAILLAKDTIYIHDWWLSPELQLRRPNKPKYRLDRLLERKAKEGVKIFVIVYNEVSSRTTPTDSNYAKQRLINLHENIMVQRSPSHFQTGTYYWAHHEKMCVIDEAIAFMGGLDLCFGRWDTAQHILIDDGDVAGSEKGQYVWPGKDYSNERVVEFHTLNKPDQDMYDRTKVPRMPWHDVGLQIVGAPARDLARHFVQRWNYLLRNKNHTRVMPFLLPPPEFKPHELTENGLTGTCELQICRSAGPWSLGTPNKIEHSIQNAYLKAIQLSEHFVYIENQFFITSTVVSDVQIENKIGDALVHRIIRAHREGTNWKAVILIPVLPGFPSPIDQGEASAIRIILECQSRTIGRGPHSIFSRLRRENIDADEYISVYSLRGWGKLKNDVLTTEQVYIHGKVCTMIVDDRLVIIGSANINERSQRGDRDSELACVIRDTDMIDGKMDGKPYKVGRFAHTLRVRLMREHLGVDVDAMYKEDLMASDPVKSEVEVETWDPDNEQGPLIKDSSVTRVGKIHEGERVGTMFHDLKDAATQALHTSVDATSKDAGRLLRTVGIKSGNMGTTADSRALEEERQGCYRDCNKQPNFATSLLATMEEKSVIRHRPPETHGDGKPILGEIQESTKSSPDDGDGELANQRNEARVQDGSGELYVAPADVSYCPQTDDQPPHARQGKDDSNDTEKTVLHARSTLRKHLSSRVGVKPWTLPVPGPIIDPNGFEDPICDAFFKDIWVAAAVHNTEIYRRVFHAIPDDLITTWKQYKEFIQHHDRLQRPVKKDKDTSSAAEPMARIPSEAASHTMAPGGSDLNLEKSSNGAKEGQEATPRASTSRTPEPRESRANRPSRPDEPFEQWERDEMEALLGQVRGHLVVYSTRFLEGEDLANNFLFPADRYVPCFRHHARDANCLIGRLLPLPIYI
ncbi:phospholipase D [Hysterangium stoloniferum]|nr:phospholipase D [Hysterangium stoloniferum]